MISHDKEATDTMADAGQRLLASENAGEQGVVYTRERRSKWQLFRSWFGSFTLGALFSLIVVGVMYQLQLQTERKPSWKFAKTDAVPSVPYETVIWDADPIYSQRPNDESDFAWNMLLPNGRGFVFVDHPEDRGLLDGEQTRYGPIYSVSMFHQLHCLARLRKMHWLFLDGVASGELDIAKHMTGREATTHVQHCFDYLRQAITCAGDMTLEWPKQDGPSSKAKVDGWGVPHTCKSKSVIDDYMSKNHFNESISFDATG